MELLLEVSKEMSAEKGTSSLAQTIVNGIAKLTKLKTAAIYSIHGDFLYLEATHPPLPPDFPEHLRRAPLNEHPHIKKAIVSKKPVILPDTKKAALSHAEREVCQQRGLRSILYNPLIYKGKTIGVLIPASVEKIHKFSEDEVSICQTLASHAALSISEAKLFENQQHYLTQIQEKNKSLEQAEKNTAESLKAFRRALLGIVHSMGTLMSKRDNYTAGHQQRVSELSGEIARVLDLEDDRIEGLKLAAKIHDIGKLSIPTEILTKPQKLTDLEFKIIETHPNTGYEILNNIEFPWPIAEIVKQHHEKVDGSGYPDGLTGEDILFEARILCVADVVEAMASHRPYRPALGIDVALDEIWEKRGSLFDPDVVNACMKLFKEEGFQLE